MRLERWAFLAVVALVFANNASAQNFQSALTGIKPSDVQQRKVDTANAMGGVAQLSSVGQPRFSLTSFFRKITTFGGTTLGRSNIPNQQYNNAYKPLQPVNSTVEIRR